MNLNERFDISPKKEKALRDRIRRLGIKPEAIEERFIRGSGPGGQKINKTANAVQLRYPPLDLVVRCQKDRRRTVNRFVALRELVDRIEMRISPETSRRLDKAERRRRSRRRANRRARSRHRDLKERPPTRNA